MQIVQVLDNTNIGYIVVCKNIISLNNKWYKNNTKMELITNYFINKRLVLNERFINLN